MEITWVGNGVSCLLFDFQELDKPRKLQISSIPFMSFDMINNYTSYSVSGISKC